MLPARQKKSPSPPFPPPLPPALPATLGVGPQEAVVHAKALTLLGSPLA